MKTALFLDVTLVYFYKIILPHRLQDSDFNGSHMGSQGYSVRSKADKCNNL